MKNLVLFRGLGVVLVGTMTLALTVSPPPAEAAETRLEAVPRLCSGLDPRSKPVVAVMDFKVKVDVTGDVGGGMASMLSNALLNSGCFLVAERERLDDVMAEQAFGMSGAVAEPSAAGVGRIQGARYQIMGEITEFSDGESGVGAVAGALGRRWAQRRGFNRSGAALGVRKAHIGFIIKIVDTSTALVIGSQSFDKKRKSVGLVAGGWWGGDAFGAGFQLSKAMADAIEEGIIEALRYIVPYGQQMAGSSLTADAGVSAPVPGECALLEGGGTPPRIMVILPEEHLMGVWGAYGEGRAFDFDEYEGDRHAAGSAGGDARAMLDRMIRPPDPAGETEIIKRFLEHGFPLVDDRFIEALRGERRFRQANDDVSVASDIGREFGADVVITGEAFSEFSKNINGMMSCRARVEAKAIDARSGRIIAADGLHASAIDVSEVIAGKTALREAGGKVADYFIARICSDRTASYGGSGAAEPAGRTTELIVSRVDFLGSSRIQDAIDALALVSGVEKQYFQDRTTSFLVTHGGTTDQLAEQLVASGGDLSLEITELESGRIVAHLKDAAL